MRRPPVLDAIAGRNHAALSRVITRVWRVAEALEYGIAGINTGIISAEVSPVGSITA